MSPGIKEVVIAILKESVQQDCLGLLDESGSVIEDILVKNNVNQLGFTKINKGCCFDIEWRLILMNLKVLWSGNMHLTDRCRRSCVI